MLEVTLSEKVALIFRQPSLFFHSSSDPLIHSLQPAPSFRLVSYGCVPLQVIHDWCEVCVSRMLLPLLALIYSHSFIPAWFSIRSLLPCGDRHWCWEVFDYPHTTDFSMGVILSLHMYRAYVAHHPPPANCLVCALLPSYSLCDLPSLITWMLSALSYFDLPCITSSSLQQSAARSLLEAAGQPAMWMSYTDPIRTIVLTTAQIPIENNVLCCSELPQKRMGSAAHAHPPGDYHPSFSGTQKEPRKHLGSCVVIITH